MLKLHNTLTGTKDDFVPLDPNRVTLYVCGPTVYNYVHIGNARPVVVFDVLYRLLARLYPEVVYARNITDIDDKIIKACAETGESMDALTGRFTTAFREDMAALGTLEPTITPLATDHIADMIAMIETLIAKGHAYESQGHVLFAVESMPDYGKLSGRNLEDMLAGARVEVADYKRHPGDFVLWKPSDADQPGWDSPWGRGRPGWHIECSAMIHKHLGDVIDIHGGGQDLIFPHHENEIAQGCCAHGTEYVRYWMHNGYINIDGEKMSKSLGNFRLVRELLKEYPGEVLRFALLSSHYRSPLNFSAELLEQAERSLDSLYYALLGRGETVRAQADYALPRTIRCWRRCSTT
ncbi:Cysteine--tRNA ligase [Alcanivorax sp. ALC70]|nr:Cysteine--tRNA ligase [Alcanivorax sp. ALC70]